MLTSHITENVVIVSRAPNYHRQCTLGRLDAGLRNAPREHRRDIINGGNDLPVPFHFNQTNHTLENMEVSVLKAGLANQEYRK